MEKKEAEKLIKSTFNSKFDLEQYTFFMRNLLNDYDDEKERDWSQGSFIYEAFREHISRFKRLGVYSDPEGNEIELLVVETKGTSKLEKARTSLRNFIIKRLNDRNRDYALVAFYSKDDNGADWRFSFIKIEHESYKDNKGKVKVKKELTPAKRFSFLVGEHENVHTAVKQIFPVLQNTYSKPTIEDLEKIFSIEKVTDEFFEQYKDLYIKLSEHFEADNLVQSILNEAEFETARFTKKLLGQIVFLYFLQKKGWLGVPKNETWGKGDKRFLQTLFTDTVTVNKNFFNDYLKFLFYEALAKARSNSPDPSYYKRFDCKIPFLNGGLFEADFDWENTNLLIPNELFRNTEKNKAGDIGTGVLDVFDRYNFTIKEDEPLEKEVAVDPEMLGKVFENLLEIKDRKSKGAFYTPREIVHYMCQESLIHYLDNALNDAPESFQAINTDQLNMFGGTTDKKGQAKIEIEHKGKTIVPKTDIEIFIRKGFLATDNDQVIIDKGKETDNYKFKLPESIRENADDIDKYLTNIKICDPAIGSGAFPVGILHELVVAQKVVLPYLSDNYLEKKLCKIHLDKSEFKKDPDNYVYRVKRHAIQESIYGVDIDASAVDIARLRLWLSLIVDEDDFYSIEALPNLDYKIVKGNSLIGLPENAMRDLDTQNELEILKETFFDETNENKKKELRNDINKKIRELLDSAETYAGYKIDFDYELFFSEVWHYKNGFDIVIGNPPYGSSLTNDEKKILRNQFDDFEFKIDSYEAFILVFDKKLNSRGLSYFIIPSNLMDNFFSKKIRKKLLTKNSLLELIELDDKIFKGAVVHSMIIGWKKKIQEKYIITCKIGSINESSTFYESSDFFINEENTNYSLRKIKYKDLLKKIYLNSRKLESILKLKDGIDTGDNKKFISEENIDGWKKVIGGSDVDRWNIKSHQFINYGRHLANPRDPILFENPKIVIRETGDKIIAAYDENSYYALSTLYSGYLVDKNYSYKVILGLLHSEIIHFLMTLIAFGRTKGAFTKTRIFHYYTLPVNDGVKTYDKIIETYVDYIAFLNTKKDWVLLTNFYNSLLNSVFYEIYFPFQFKSSNKEIISNIGRVISIKENMSDEEKLAVIQSEFNRLYDPNHIVRNNLEHIDSVEEVRIIKEALK